MIFIESSKNFKCQIQHNQQDLQNANQGENLYCGFGEGCMAKTIAQHMEIGESKIWISKIMTKKSIFDTILASKLWQHEINDFDMAGCVDENCNSITNCAANAQFGCGHFTQQIWKTTTHMCYQDWD